MKFGRVMTAMITPFDKEGEVSYERMAELSKYLIENGSDSLLVTGTTGESPTLTTDEKLKLFETVKRNDAIAPFFFLSPVCPLPPL